MANTKYIKFARINKRRKMQIQLVQITPCLMRCPSIVKFLVDRVAETVDVICILYVTKTLHARVIFHRSYLMKTRKRGKGLVTIFAIRFLCTQDIHRAIFNIRVSNLLRCYVLFRFRSERCEWSIIVLSIFSVYLLY